MTASRLPLSDTLRAYLERTKQGKFDEAEMARLAAEKERRQREEEEKAAGIGVGDRCEVARPAQLPTRGTVRFCGESGCGWRGEMQGGTDEMEGRGGRTA